jgi:predicted aspartyl protease
MPRIPQPIDVILGPPETGGFVRRPPLILVHLAADPAWNPGIGVWPTHNGKSYFALLDTGADFCAIDAAAASEIGAELKGNGSVRSFGEATRYASNALTQVLLPSAGQVYEARFSVMDFRGAQQPWDVILGRNFLRHCRFVVDGPAGRYTLEWVGAPPTSR